MTSIVVYDRRPADPDDGASRRAGMIDAGSRLKTALAGADSDNDVEDAVNAVLGTYAPDGAVMQALVESNDGGDDLFFKVKEGTGGKFNLENLADASDTKRLKLDGKIDKFENSNLYTMTSVAPKGPIDANSWAYLTGKVVPDVLALVGAHVANPAVTTTADIEDYLIATFAFTRCR